MRVLIVSTHRAERAHYAPLLRLLTCDERFAVEQLDKPWAGIREQPDVAVVLGDRYEMLLTAARLVELRVPLLHIHGGEHTIGSLDERWRWAMTMLADVHCVATEQAQWEVDQHILGDAKPGFTDAYRRLSLKSYVTGAPGLDDIIPRQPIAGAAEVLVLYNPVIEEQVTRDERLAIAVAIIGLDTAWVEPNGDRYSEVIQNFRMRPSMPPNQFRDLLAAAKVIVGNSSSGIIEAPSLGTWTVNVGDRQKRRERAGNVIDVPADATAIRAALADALQRPRYSGPNPYAHPAGKASEAIRNVLLDMGG